MSKIWKIGTQWGYDGESIINLFLDYGCVFLGYEEDCLKIGHWWEVKNGDIFAICCGRTVVALGQSQGTFAEDPNGHLFSFRQMDVKNFVWNCGHFFICPAKILWIPKELRTIKLEKWAGRFYEVKQDAKKIQEMWETLCQEEQKKTFDIRTRAASLCEIDGNEKPIFENETSFHIPIYQRPYSWDLAKLRRMMEDLHQGLKDAEPMFLGTLQFSSPIILDEEGMKKSYDVIDGQQRLTTLMIFLLLFEKILGKSQFGKMYFEKSFRTSVNKRAAQEDLQELYEFIDEYDIFSKEIPPRFQNSCEYNIYIRNCIAIADLIMEFSTLDEEDSDNDEKIKQYSKDLYSFICSKIKIVVIETHAGLAKTLKIFDTINTAGMPLGVDDIFKLHFYEYMRNKGATEQVFDEISELYERVEKYNKNPYGDMLFSMGSVLVAYQRILIAKAELSNTTFSMSYGSFFNQLFETRLHVREYPEFKKFDQELSIGELKKIIQCYVDYYETCSQNPDLNIFRSMFGKTRYGYVSDFPVIALYFDVVNKEDLHAFVRDLVKGLIPHSLYWAKTVNDQRRHLINFLRDMNSHLFKKGDSLVEYCRDRWTANGVSLKSALNASVGNVIAWNPKWKNLLCSLAEYLLTPETERNENLYNRLFKVEYDIEHIQPYTDEKNSQLVRNDWGDELNKIGNLALFERSLNRKVKNHPDKKQEAYGESVYMSINLLKDKVVGWSKEDARSRREMLEDMIKNFILS